MGGLMVEITPAHIDLVQGMAWKFLKDSPARPGWLYEELVSAGLEALRVAVQEFDPDRGYDFERYIFTRVKLGMIDQYRALFGRGTKRPDSVPLEDLSDPQLYQSQLFSRLDLLERLDLHRELHREVAKLSMRERLVIYYYFWQGRTQAEIGRLLDLTGGRISQLRTQALKTLRRRLAPCVP